MGCFHLDRENKLFGQYFFFPLFHSKTLSLKYNVYTDIETCGYRHLLALPPMDFLSSAPPPNPVSLTALQKQLRKCNEIVILSQVSPPNIYIRASMVF